MTPAPLWPSDRGYLRELFLEAGDVLDEPLTDELQEVEPELGILIVELFDLWITDSEQLPTLDAFECRRALINEVLEAALKYLEDRPRN